jgi:hypothetical protein
MEKLGVNTGQRVGDRGHDGQLRRGHFVVFPA